MQSFSCNHSQCPHRHNAALIKHCTPQCGSVTNLRKPSEKKDIPPCTAQLSSKITTNSKGSKGRQFISPARWTGDVQTPHSKGQRSETSDEQSPAGRSPTETLGTTKRVSSDQPYQLWHHHTLKQLNMHKTPFGTLPSAGLRLSPHSSESLA